ncbi:MAG: sugar/nucleoside kinase (ribokinase family), partial [bacterium]
MRRGFICAGCWTADRIKIIDRWPAEEELATITGVDQQGGGSAHNVGIDIRKLDVTMPVATVGMLGDDTDGDFLFSQANKHQVETLQLRRTQDKPTSYTDVITVSNTGKRTFFHH